MFVLAFHSFFFFFCTVRESQSFSRPEFFSIDLKSAYFPTATLSYRLHSNTAAPTQDPRDKSTSLHLINLHPEEIDQLSSVTTGDVEKLQILRHDQRNQFSFPKSLSSCLMIIFGELAHLFFFFFTTSSAGKCP